MPKLSLITVALPPHAPLRKMDLPLPFAATWRSFGNGILANPKYYPSKKIEKDLTLTIYLFEHKYQSNACFR